MKRKIAAIVAADVAGYTKLVNNDEEGTLARLQVSREVFDEFVSRYGGRIFNTAGDAVLAEFASAVEAVRCALEIQESLRTKNLGVPEDSQMLFRLGINIGDIVERDGDLLGDGVNIAARLQTLSEPGGICISRAVYEQVANKLAVGFADIGPQMVKNLPNPIHAYYVDAQLERQRPRPAPALQTKVAIAATAAVIGIGLAGALWIWFGREAPRATTVAQAPASAVEAPRASQPAAPVASALTPPPVAATPPPVEVAPPPAAPAPEPPRTAVVAPPAAPAPLTSGATVEFNVALSCEKLAWTVGPLYQTDGGFTVKGSKAEFQRPIHYPLLTSPVVGTEVATGTIGSGGRLVLEGGWASSRRQYKARYEGTLTLAGGTLSGRQDWISEGKPFVRNCSLTVTRK